MESPELLRLETGETAALGGSGIVKNRTHVQFALEAAPP
jgi:hypothetical protein